MKIKTLFAALLILASCNLTWAQPLEREKLDQFFDRLAEKNKAMGSLVIAKDGKSVYSRAIGYGQIDGEQKIPLTAASRFRIGSITKMFTTVIIFQLVDEGKLKLSDRLDKFVPQIPNAQKITIEQILAHRSGIPNVRRERDPQNPRRELSTIPMRREEMLALLVKAPSDFEPGSRFSYSNSGFWVLGFVIEKLAGKPYEQVLQERITSRIGLEDTYFTAVNIDVNKNEALNYINAGHGAWRQGPETHPTILYSAGAIVSTPSDMAKFIAALFDGKLVSNQSLEMMKTIRDGEGMGMGTFMFAGKTFYGHTGGADSYGAWLAYLPEEKLAVAYTTNAKVWPVKNIVSGVIDIYYGKPFAIPTFETVAVRPEVLDKYVGVYSSPEAPVKFTITRKGSTLYVQPGNEGAAALDATAQDTFELSIGVVFEFDTAKNQMIQKRGSGPGRVFTKEK